MVSIGKIVQGRDREMNEPPGGGFRGGVGRAPLCFETARREGAQQTMTNTRTTRTAKKAAEAPKARVVLDTQNPALSVLLAVALAHDVPTPEPATRKTVQRALAAAGVLLVFPGSVVPLAAKARYKAHGGTCGDAMAEAFRGCDQTEWAAVASANGIDFSRWSHLNNGQQRMNLGNVLRGKLRRGEQVDILGQKFGEEE